MRDLIIAARQLRRAPGFALGVVLSLALGLTSNLVMTTLLNTLLFQGPSHLLRPKELVRIGVYTFPDYTDLGRESRSLDGMAAYAYRDLTVWMGTTTLPVRALLTTSTFFGVLGTPMHRGRQYLAGEDNPAGPATVVLSYDFWQTRFGGRSEALGAVIRIEGEPFEIVGVAPQYFTGAELQRVDLFLPSSA